jgi:hypothetical protein
MPQEWHRESPGATEAASDRNPASLRLRLVHSGIPSAADLRPPGFALLSLWIVAVVLFVLWLVGFALGRG